MIILYIIFIYFTDVINELNEYDISIDMESDIDSNSNYTSIITNNENKDDTHNDNNRTCYNVGEANVCKFIIFYVVLFYLHH